MNEKPTLKIIEFDSVTYCDKPLKNLSLTIDKGESVALFGGDYSSRSNFLMLVNGLLLPEAGSVRVAGVDTSDKGKLFEIRRIAGFVFRDIDNQIVGATVLEDIAFGPENLSTPHDEIKESVYKALQQVELSEYVNSTVESLTKEEKIRLAIAGSLAMNPKVLLLDHPLDDLNSEEFSSIYRLLLKLKLNSRLTIICATGSKKVAEKFDRRILLSEDEAFLDICDAELSVDFLDKDVKMSSFSTPTGSKNGIFHKIMTLGQYIKGNSILHRIDPRSKIIMTFFILLFTLFTTGNATLFATLSALIPLSRYTGRSLSDLTKGFAFITSLVVIAIFMNFATITGTAVAKKGFLSHISVEAVYVSGQMIFRLLILATTASILTATTTPLSLAEGLRNLLKPLERIKIPVAEFIFILLLALRFIPVIVGEAESVMREQKLDSNSNQKSSPIQKVGLFIAILIPLFAAVVRRAEALSIAMEARCYRGAEQRSSIQTLSFSNLDIICGFILASAILSIVIFTKIIV